LLEILIHVLISTLRFDRQLLTSILQHISYVTLENPNLIDDRIVSQNTIGTLM